MRKLGAAALLAVLAWLALQGTAGAHTEVLRARPQPGTEVTGTVEEISLTFLDPVRPGTTIEVTDDDGVPLPGLTAVEESPDGRTATIGFDALSAAGGYIVEYEFTAQDGDVQLERYRFTFRPPRDGGGGWHTDAAGIGGAAVVVTTLVVALATALVRRNLVDSEESARPVSNPPA